MDYPHILAWTWHQQLHTCLSGYLLLHRILVLISKSWVSVSTVHCPLSLCISSVTTSSSHWVLSCFLRLFWFKFSFCDCSCFITDHSVGLTSSHCSLAVAALCWEVVYMDLLTKQSSDLSGHNMNIAVAVLKATQVQKLPNSDKKTDLMMRRCWLAINAHCCTQNSKLRTQNHNLNHILMNNVRASL